MGGRKWGEGQTSARPFQKQQYIEFRFNFGLARFSIVADCIVAVAGVGVSSALLI